MPPKPTHPPFFFFHLITQPQKQIEKEKKKITQPLQNCIGPTIRIGQEILCLPYAGFFLDIHLFTDETMSW